MPEPEPPAAQALARALHAVFEGFVGHLPADDPDWVRYAEQVLDRLADDEETANETRRPRLAQLIADDEAERGPISENELARVRDELRRHDHE